MNKQQIPQLPQQHVHHALQDMWRHDQAHNPDQIWQCKSRLGSGWYDLVFAPAWISGSEYRRKPAAAPAIHVDAQMSWAADQTMPNPPVWQATKIDGSWMDIDRGTEPRWFKSRQYRRKPSPGFLRDEGDPHQNERVEWAADQLKLWVPVWQATKIDGSWMDIDRGTEPRWFKSRQYRRKPAEVIAAPPVPTIPAIHVLAKKKWDSDTENYDGVIWQATRIDGSWMDIDQGVEPRWFKSRRYRRKPVVRYYGMAVNYNDDTVSVFMSAEHDLEDALQQLTDDGYTVVNGPIMVAVPV